MAIGDIAYEMDTRKRVDRVSDLAGQIAALVSTIDYDRLTADAEGEIVTALWDARNTLLSAPSTD